MITQLWLGPQAQPGLLDEPLLAARARWSWSCCGSAPGWSKQWPPSFSNGSVFLGLFTTRLVRGGFLLQRFWRVRLPDQRA